MLVTYSQVTCIRSYKMPAILAPYDFRQCVFSPQRKCLLNLRLFNLLHLLDFLVCVWLCGWHFLKHSNDTSLVVCVAKAVIAIMQILNRFYRRLSVNHITHLLSSRHLHSKNSHDTCDISVCPSAMTYDRVLPHDTHELVHRHHHTPTIDSHGI